MTSLAYYALWIFVFSLPWESVLTLPGVAIISRAAGALALGMTLLAVVVSAHVRRWHLTHVAALLFVIWAGVGLWAVRTDRVPQKYWTFLQLFAVLWMIWELAPTPRRQIGLLTAYVAGAYVAAFDTILVFRREGSALRRFAAGTFDPNDLAMTLALAIPMAWYLGMTYKRPLLRWLCRGYLPIGLMAIGLTGSRGGMLVTIIALSFVPMTMTKLSPGKRAAALVILGLSGVLAATYVPTRIVQRLSTTGTEVEDLRFGGRFKLWVAGVHAFTKKPVMGYGTSSYKGAITPFLGSASQVAHNSYLSVLVEEGIVGFFLYGTMIVAVVASVWKLPTLERRFALTLLATLGMAMMPLTWEDRKPVWFILATLVCFAESHLPRRTVAQPVAGFPAESVRRPSPVPLPRARAATRPPMPPLRTPRRDA